MSGPKDDTLLLRRYRLQGEASVSVDDPALDLRPTSTQQSAGADKLPQPPQLNRQVQSVFDARPSFAREFTISTRRNITLPVGVNATSDFNVDIPQGYVGVMRRFRAWFEAFAQETDQDWFAQVLLNGVPIPDVSNSGFASGFPGMPLLFNANVGTNDPTIQLDGQFIDFYLEGAGGGSFGVRLIGPAGDGVENSRVVVQIAGQFVRADNVPVELQIATPPQVTPVVPADQYAAQAFKR